MPKKDVISVPLLEENVAICRLDEDILNQSNIEKREETYKLRILMITALIICFVIFVLFPHQIL